MYVIYVKQGPTFRCKTMVSKHKNLFVHACFYTVVYSITFQNSQTVSLAVQFTSVCSILQKDSWSQPKSLFLPSNKIPSINLTCCKINLCVHSTGHVHTAAQLLEKIRFFPNTTKAVTDLQLAWIHPEVILRTISSYNNYDDRFDLSRWFPPILASLFP